MTPQEQDRLQALIHAIAARLEVFLNSVTDIAETDLPRALILIKALDSVFNVLK